MRQGTKVQNVAVPIRAGVAEYPDILIQPFLYWDRQYLSCWYVSALHIRHHRWLRAYTSTVTNMMLRAAHLFPVFHKCLTSLWKEFTSSLAWSKRECLKACVPTDATAAFCFLDICGYLPDSSLAARQTVSSCHQQNDICCWCWGKVIFLKQLQSQAPAVTKQLVLLWLLCMLTVSMLGQVDVAQFIHINDNFVQMLCTIRVFHIAI